MVSRSHPSVGIMCFAVTSLAFIELVTCMLDSKFLPMGDVPHRLRSRILKTPDVHRRDMPTQDQPEILIMTPNGGVRVTGAAPEEEIEIFEPGKQGDGDGDEDDFILSDVGAPNVPSLDTLTLMPSNLGPEDVSTLETTAQKIQVTVHEDTGTESFIELTAPRETVTPHDEEVHVAETPAPAAVAPSNLGEIFLAQLDEDLSAQNSTDGVNANTSETADSDGVVASDENTTATN